MKWRECVTFDEIREYAKKNQDAVATAWKNMLDDLGPGKPYSLADYADEARHHGALDSVVCVG